MYFTISLEQVLFILIIFFSSKFNIITKWTFNWSQETTTIFPVFLCVANGQKKKERKRTKGIKKTDRYKKLQ